MCVRVFAHEGFMNFKDGSGRRYDGEFSAHKFHGQGSVKDSKGAVLYGGTFKEGVHDGPGCKLLEATGGDMYTGMIVMGIAQGEGTAGKDKSGQPIRGGSWADDMQEASRTCTDTDKGARHINSPFCQRQRLLLHPANFVFLLCMLLSFVISLSLTSG